MDMGHATNLSSHFYLTAKIRDPMAKGSAVALNERTYIIEGLKSGIRINGRKFYEMRAPEIKISKSEYGFVEVQLGKSKLAVRVSSQIVKPYEDRPFEGIFTINTEVSPMASPLFENGKNTDDEVLISRLIEKAVRRSNALDLESLCIIAGEKVWHVTADINFLNYDGGFIDASCLGVMCALQHFKKPDISVKGTEVIVYDYEERQPVSLSILHVPICVTFSFFNAMDKVENIKGDLNQELAIIDADLSEESVRDAFLVITTNKNKELIQISKSGGLPIDGVSLLSLADKAFAISEGLSEKIKTLLKADEAERYRNLKLNLLEAGASI